jgi:hypothetical protein
MHVVSGAQGIPLAVTAVRSRRGPHRRRPGKLRADKACYSADTLSLLRERGIIARSSRSGIESFERLERHRWKIESSISWPFEYRTAASLSGTNAKAATSSHSSASPPR